MSEPNRLEKASAPVAEMPPPRLAATIFAPAARDSAERDPSIVIHHLKQQLEEVRKLNRRLEIMNSELVAAKSDLRYRLVDEACEILKRRRIGQWAARLVLPFARKARWFLRQRAAR